MTLTERERTRLTALTLIEQPLWAQGLRVGGMDEVGRGPLAGPVVAACVIMPPEPLIPGINDSKKVAKARREKLARAIAEQAVCYGVGLATPREIDRINILRATRLAMERAVGAMGVKPDRLLVDAVTDLQIDIPTQSMVKGDAVSYCIAAASILAKVVRDAMMARYDARYPGYGFGQHAGYGTRAHIDALHELDKCPIHRDSFLTRILPDGPR